MSGRVRSKRDLRPAGLLAALAAVVSLSACGHSYRDKVDYTVALNVQDAAGVPVPGVTARVWIVDGDVLGAGIPLEARLTNAEGRAEWTYSAFEAPFLNAFEVRSQAGVVLADGTAGPQQRLDVATPGEFTVTLAP